MRRGRINDALKKRKPEKKETKTTKPPATPRKTKAESKKDDESKEILE